MQNRFSFERHSEPLSDAEAERLLGRASELDAVRTAVSSVADLRAAAGEAGISAPAFDAALAELHEDSGGVEREIGRQPPLRSRRWALSGLVAALFAAGALFVTLQRAPTGGDATAGTPGIEEALLLHCVSPAEAAALIRPILSLPWNTIVVREEAPRVLTLRATPDQLQRAKELLAKYEGAESSSCAPRPAGT
jgi:hypothetical protein